MRTMDTLTRRAKRMLTLAVVAGFAATSPVALAQENENDARKELAAGKRLIVNVDDLAGMANIRNDFIRENLLQSAFYGAADDKDWIGEFDFRYNYNVPEDRGGYLEFNVVDWERSVTNFYQCTVTATYRTLDGERINLGTFFGRKSGIAVLTGWEVGEAFEEVAEEAFSQALEKLAEERSLT